MFLNEIFNQDDIVNAADAAEMLDVQVKTRIEQNWDEYSRIGSAEHSEDNTSEKLNFIFSQFGDIASTSSVYQVISVEHNELLVRFATHEARPKHLRKQVKRIPTIIIYDFVFVNEDDDILPPETVRTRVGQDIVETTHNKIVVNRSHLDEKENVTSLIDSLISLFETGIFIHPFNSAKSIPLPQPSDTETPTDGEPATDNNPQNPSAMPDTQLDSNSSDEMKESIRRIVRQAIAESQRRPRIVRLTESYLRMLVRESVVEYRRKKNNYIHSNNNNMRKKNTIRLTESQLRKVIKESVRRMLWESEGMQSKSELMRILDDADREGVTLRELCRRLDGFNYNGELFDINWGAYSLTIGETENGFEIVGNADVWDDDGQPVGRTSWDEISESRFRRKGYSR